MDIKVEIASYLIKKYHEYKIRKILKNNKFSSDVKVFLIIPHLRWLEANSNAKELTQKLHDVYDILKGLKK